MPREKSWRHTSVFSWSGQRAHVPVSVELCVFQHRERLERQWSPGTGQSSRSRGASVSSHSQIGYMRVSLLSLCVFSIFQWKNKMQITKRWNQHIQSFILDITLILCILPPGRLCSHKVSKWVDLINCMWPWTAMFIWFPRKCVHGYWKEHWSG